MSPKIKGYVLASVAAATYGMNPLFALPLYADGMDSVSVLFFRYLFSIPILAVMIKVRGRSFGVNPKSLPMLLLMGLLLAGSSLTLFYSYHYMEAGIASTMLFVYPIMVALIMAVFFKEHITLQTVLCIVLALCGIVLLYNGEDGTALHLTGLLFVMLSALSYAIYIVGVNQSSLHDMPTVKLTFYVISFGFILFFAVSKCATQLTFPTHWYMWGNLLALALLPTVVSFLCTTQAIQYIGSTPTAILGALEPVTAVFFGVMLFGEQLTPRLVAGIVLIVLAVTLVVVGGGITIPLVRFRKLFPKKRRL